MTTVTVTVRNKDRLYQKLLKLAPAAEKELAVAGGKSANEMVQAARAFVPVDTGALRDSIVATPPGGTPPSYSRGATGAVPPGAWMVTAGNRQVRYAHLVEFGVQPFVAGGRFAGAQHPGNRARPFFWPAYRLVRRRHRSRAGRAISKSIKDVART